MASNTNSSAGGGRRTPRMASQTSRPLAEDPDASDDSTSNTTSYKCDVGDCIREFGSKIGLGLHRRRAHPIEANEAIDTNRKRARWNEEEVKLLAKAEAKAIREGVGVYMNMHLDGLFPGRTLESIKKRRQNVDYRRLVLDFVREDEENEQPASSSQHTEYNESVDLTVAVKHEIRATIDQLDNPSKHTKYLIKIAEDVLEGRSTAGRLRIWLRKSFPNARTPKGPCPNTGHTLTGNRKHKRSCEYNAFQKLYKKDRGAVARLILDEPGNSTMPPQEDMIGFWTQVFGNERAFDTESPDAVQENEGLRGLWFPIKEDEILSAELDCDSAAGPDGISVLNWTKVPTQNRKLVYNIILLEGTLESELCEARTVFLPKSAGELTPGQFRPLSIMSVVVRQFHKILSRRFLDLHKFDERQKAFINCDGTVENLSILSTILADAKMRRKQLHIATLDIRKAFDSVPHSVVIDTIKALGFPSNFVLYIERLYKEARTTLQYMGTNTIIDILCGVLQGDPLSPLLFNAVMDRILKIIDPDIGYKINGQLFNCIAYADDIILMSSTKMGMQTIVSQTGNSLRSCGLEINTEKSCVLSLMPSGREKKIKVITSESISVNNVTLKQVGVLDAWKYLGIMFEGTEKAKYRASLCADLEKLCHAPLKPQQRIQILKNSVFSKHLHSLVLGRTTVEKLKSLDDEVKRSIRAWLRLPKDTPLPYFYASVKSGGLGLMCLAETIPIMRKSRLERFIASGTIAAEVVRDSFYVDSQWRWCNRALAHIGENVDKNMQKRYWDDLMESKYDTMHLTLAKGCKASTSWVHGKANEITGRDYVRHHHVRVGCLPSQARMRRGVQSGPRMCRAGCRVPETNYHVIQQCHRTHGGRILRHDRLVNFIGEWLSTGRKKYQVRNEERFRTPIGLRKPDLLITKDDSTLLLDIQVVSGTRMQEDSAEKVGKYKTVPGLEEQILQVCGSTRLEYGALTISYKGIFHKDSAELLYKLGINEHQMFMLTTSVLRGSWLNWSRFNQMTTFKSMSPRRRVR